MRALIFVLMIGMTPAVAAPISGTYGDAYGCKVGPNGDDDGSAKDYNSNWIVVTPSGANGHEWGCTFQSSHGGKIKATCYAEGFDSHQTVTAIENRQAGTLTYTDDAGTMVLHRCPD